MAAYLRIIGATTPVDDTEVGPPINRPITKKLPDPMGREPLKKYL
jgi:hypothetical protein